MAVILINLTIFKADRQTHTQEQQCSLQKEAAVWRHSLE